MARHSYKTALRAKGIRKLPPYRRLRSSYAGGEVIDATAAQRQREPRRAVLRLHGVDVPLIETAGPLRYERGTLLPSLSWKRA